MRSAVPWFMTATLDEAQLFLKRTQTNLVRLLSRVGDIADAVGENTAEQARICESAERLLLANQVEDGRNLLAKAVGMSEANERVMAVIRAIFVEIALEGVDMGEGDK